MLVRHGERTLALCVPRGVALAGACWIALCVASFAWSARPGYTLGELQTEIGYPALAFVVFNIGAREMRDLRIAAVVLMFGAALLGLFVWIALLYPGLYYAERYHAVAGYFSTHLVMVAPMLAVAAWSRPDGMDWPWRGVAVAAAVLVAAGLASENRMLWVALAVGGIAAFAAVARGPAHARVSRARTILPLVIAVFALAVAASAQYKAQRYYPGEGALEAVARDERPIIWESGWQTLLERPWLGHGFGRAIAADTMARRITERGSVNQYDHAHNVFLDVGLQLGLVGVLVFVALLAAIARAYVLAAMREGTVLAGVVGVAMLASFVAKSLTDDFFYRPDSLIFWALNGLLLRLSWEPPWRKSP
jgi:O-antigen ligase